MKRVMYILPYAVIGVTLAASLGAAALAFSMDVKQFAPSDLDMETQIEREIGIPALETRGPDELRMWSYGYERWDGPRMYLTRVTPGRIEQINLDHGSWARRWAVVRRVTRDTAVAGEILGLLDQLRPPEVDENFCIHGATWLTGRAHGETFEHHYSCGFSAVAGRVWKLIESVPGFSE